MWFLLLVLVLITKRCLLDELLNDTDFLLPSVILFIPVVDRCVLYDKTLANGVGDKCSRLPANRLSL